MNIIQIFKRFPTQEACIKHLEKVRWKGKPKCPYCGSENTNKLKNEGRFRHHCNGCRKSFRVTVGTVFHNTNLPLQKWFFALALILNARKGISSRQLARDLELPVKTAWFLNMRIRKAMQSDSRLLQGIVEMDETFIGGKPRKKNIRDDDGDPPNPRGRGTLKTPVVGIIERGGEVRLSVEDKNTLRSKNLMSLVRKNVDMDSSVLITDEYPGYRSMSKQITHLVIPHNQLFADNNIYTNTIESFFALLKRGIIGQFHKVSKKYLPEYINEFSYRFNSRFFSGEYLFDRTVERLLCMT